MKNLLKFNIRNITILSFLTSTFFIPARAEHIPKNHFYAGASVALNKADVKNSGNITNLVDLPAALGPGAPVLNFRLSAPEEITNSIVAPELLLGYDIALSSWLSFDFEARADFYNRKFTSQTSLKESANPVSLMYSVAVKQKNEFNFILKPNIHLSSKAKIFVLGGITKSQISSKAHAFFMQGLDPGTGSKIIFTANSDVYNSKKYRNGYILGLGIEHELKNNVGLRFEYNHSKFKNYSNKQIISPINVKAPAGFPIVIPATVPNSMMTLSHKKTFKNDAIKLGLTYSFS